MLDSTNLILDLVLNLITKGANANHADTNNTSPHRN